MQKSIYIFFASYFLAAFPNLYFFFLQIRLNQRLLRLSLKIIILSKHSLHASDDQANRIVVVESYLLFFVLFIYFPTIWWSRGGTSCAGGTSKLYLTIVLAQVTTTAPRFLLQKKGRLRLIWRRRPFDQYADQYQKISGWTQWTRQWFVPVETGAKSAGKHPIAGLWRPDASSHAGGHWFESSSLHQILGNQAFPRIFSCF